MSLLPSEAQIKMSLSHPLLTTIIDECEKFNKPLAKEYYRFGSAIHQVQPWSVTWIVASLALRVFPCFDQTYYFALGKMFVRSVHTSFLDRCETILVQEPDAEFAHLKDHPTIIQAVIHPKSNVFFKSDFNNSESRGALEELVWNCAKILDLDDYFAPTRFLPKIGCVQPRIKGFTLADLFENNYLGLSKNEIIIGTMITLFFGFTDAHANNLIVDKRGQLRFIDNSRCFPHSNDFILFSNDLFASFRCGLVECFHFYTYLDEDDWSVADTLFKQFKSKFPLIIEAINSVSESFFPGTKDYAGTCWYDKELIVAALKQRIDRMEDTLNNRSAGSLRDLVFAVHPGYRFAAAMALAELDDVEEVLLKNDLLLKYRIASSNVFNRINLQCQYFWTICGRGFSFKKRIEKANLVDCMELYKLCSDPSIDFDEIIDRIAFSTQQYVTDEGNQKMLLEALYSAAKQDFKS